jgi:hypothetical protein
MTLQPRQRDRETPSSPVESSPPRADAQLWVYSHLSANGPRITPVKVEIVSTHRHLISVSVNDSVPRTLIDRTVGVLVAPIDQPPVPLAVSLPPDWHRVARTVDLPLRAPGSLEMRRYLHWLESVEAFDRLLRDASASGGSASSP